MRKLADYPSRCSPAAAATSRRTTSPSTCATLAAAFHSYYAAERFLVDDAALARARLALLVGDAPGAAQRARACSASSAPERMSRESRNPT